MNILFDQFIMNQEILVYDLDYLIAIFTIIIILIIIRKKIEISVFGLENGSK